MRLIDKKNSVVVIVSYNPGYDMIKSFDILTNIVSKVIIVDNGSQNREGLDIIKNNKCDKLCLIESEENRGIAWGLNTGIREALSYSPEWIITFDQDSIPALNILDVYNEVVLLHPNPDQIGVMCGGFNLHEDRATFPVNWKSSLVLITSGMLHNVNVFKDVGWYNEMLFIDSVDFEFTMRVRDAGYDTLFIQNDVIQHKIGAPLVRQIWRFSFESSNHNEMRRYYQARNLVYLTRNFIRKFPQQILNFDYYFLFKVLPRLIIVERPLNTKIKALLRGFWDGLFLK